MMNGWFTRQELVTPTADSVGEVCISLVKEEHHVFTKVEVSAEHKGGRQLPS